MKKNILKLGLVILFIIFFALLMPKATFAASIEKIEITVPEPVIGEELTTDASKIQIKADDGQSFVIDEIGWAYNEYSTSTNQYLGYKEVSDFSKACNNRDKYKLQLSFFVPNTYTPSSNIVITVNGTQINTKNIEELNWGSYGDVNNDGVFVCFDFGNAKIQKEISKIEITVPEPVIGEKLTTDASKIQVKDGDGESFEIENIDWYYDKLVVPGTHLNNYEKITDFTKPCNNTDKYQLQLGFLVPNKYVPSSNVVVTVNGTKIDVKNIEELNWGSTGDINNDEVGVTFKFGNAKPQKEISKIEITSPTPVAGEKLTTDISKFEVKIDGTETLNITNIEWLSEDFKTLSSDIAEVGKKYNVRIDFNIPNKYDLSSDIIVTVNGEQINVNNIEEFNYASSGDLEFDYTCVNKLMKVKEATKEDPKEEPKDESKEETTEENATEETKKDETVNEIKNPKTGDTITISFIIFIIAVAGMALTINSIKKQNK